MNVLAAEETPSKNTPTQIVLKAQALVEVYRAPPLKEKLKLVPILRRKNIISVMDVIKRMFGQILISISFFHIWRVERIFPDCYGIITPMESHW